jgi:hypothetical protein
MSKGGRLIRLGKQEENAISPAGAKAAPGPLVATD